MSRPLFPEVVPAPPPRPAPRWQTLTAPLRDFWGLVTLVALLLLVTFVVWPLLSVFRASLIGEWSMQFGLENYQTFFGSRYFRVALYNSLYVSALATIGALLLGVPMAIIIGRYRMPAKGFVRVLAVLSLISPPFIGAYAWILMLGRAGFITRFLAEWGIQMPTIYGPTGIILVLILQFYPMAFLLAYGALQSVDRSVEEAAMNLGNPRWKVFYTITLPLIFPSVAAAALLVFLSALSDFGTPMVIGEDYVVLPTLAYNLFMSELGGNPAMASTTSSIMVVLCIGVLLFQRYIITHRRYAVEADRGPEVLPMRGWQKVVFPMFTFGTVILANLTLVVVVVISFMQTRGPVLHRGFSLDSYRQVFHLVGRAITNSVTFSFAALVLIVVLGSLIGYLLTRRDSPVTRVLDSLLMIPYVIPGTVLGIGFIVAFNEPPLYITGTALIIIAAYFTRRLPYTVRSCASFLHQLDPAVEEASINLGVPPMKTFYKIVVPLMLPGLLSGATLSWVMTINELSATIVLYVGHTLTMPIATYAEVYTGNFGPAAAVASLLLLATTISLVLFNLIGGKKDAMTF